MASRIEVSRGKYGKQLGFIDLSDYGRALAKALVRLLLPTRIGSHTLTLSHCALGCLAGVLIFFEHLTWAALLLPVKSIIDAADGEMARARNKLSHVGRYLDALCDFVSLTAILLSFYAKGSFSFLETLGILLAMHLQCSLYNYYSVLCRHQTGGDCTSKLDEYICPQPYPWDHPLLLRALHRAYLFIYGWQDRFIRRLHSDEGRVIPLGRWFLTLTSIHGSGFQLLTISIFLGVFQSFQMVSIYFGVVASSLACSLVLFRHLERYLLRLNYKREQNV